MFLSSLKQRSTNGLTIAPKSPAPKCKRHTVISSRDMFMISKVRVENQNACQLVRQRSPCSVSHSSASPYRSTRVQTRTPFLTMIEYYDLTIPAKFLQDSSSLKCTPLFNECHFWSRVAGSSLTELWKAHSKFFHLLLISSKVTTFYKNDWM